MYLLLLEHTLIKLAYGCCTNPLMTYMSKSAQNQFYSFIKIIFKKKLFNQVSRQWQDYTIKFWYEH